MAIDPKTRYPSQFDTDAAYPYGKARNETAPAARDGTPWEKDLINDVVGFQQALLSAASLTPSGTPDSATTSQYLAAVDRRIADKTFLTSRNLYPGPILYSTNFTSQHRSSVSYWWAEQTEVTANDDLWLDCSRVPRGATLVALTARVMGPSGHSEVFPTNKPSMELYLQNGFDGSLSLIDSQVDTVSDIEVYEGDHTFTMALSLDMSATTYQYLLRFKGESGGSAQTGLRLYSILAEYTLY